MANGESAGDAYDRGHVAGRIEARLASHDDHFTKLNGTTSELVGRIDELSRAVQRLVDQGVADAATRVQLAAALRDADTARRANDNDQRASRAHRLSPALVVVAVLSLLVAAASFGYAVLS